MLVKSEIFRKSSSDVSVHPEPTSGKFDDVALHVEIIVYLFIEIY